MRVVVGSKIYHSVSGSPTEFCLYLMLTNSILHLNTIVNCCLFGYFTCQMVFSLHTRLVCTWAM